MGMQIFLGFLGVCIGMVIASGVVAFIIYTGNRSQICGCYKNCPPR